MEKVAYGGHERNWRPYRGEKVSPLLHSQPATQADLGYSKATLPSVYSTLRADVGGVSMHNLRRCHSSYVRKQRPLRIPPPFPRSLASGTDFSAYKSCS